MNLHQPTLFVPHGAPTFALHPGAAGAALRRVAGTLPRPRAIVIVSPHWETAVPTVGTASRLTTIHDYWEFPDELYALRYPASGCPEAAEEVVRVLAAAGLPVSRDAAHGLDHGAWIPLRWMFPEADVPVIPLSLQSAGSPEQAYRVGRALTPLGERGFLIVGTGSLTHNLRDFQRVAQHGGETPGYVAAFADWVAARIAGHDLEALLDYRRLAPDAVRAHPREEHLLPLFLALGAAAADAQPERFHAGIDDHVIAMDAYAFRPPHPH